MKFIITFTDTAEKELLRTSEEMGIDPEDVIQWVLSNKGGPPEVVPTT